jgi:hypothetical protein
MTSAPLRDAPADRPSGQRGWRAPLACVVSIAALAALFVSSIAEGGSRAVHLVAAAALVTAAIVIWTARRTSALVLAGGLVGAAAVAAAMAGIPNRHDVTGSNPWGEVRYTDDPGGSAVTRAQARAVPKGSTEDEVEDALGPAAGSGTLRRRDGGDMRCLVYREESARREPVDRRLALCFAGDRYASLQDWW